MRIYGYQKVSDPYTYCCIFLFWYAIHSSQKGGKTSGFYCFPHRHFVSKKFKVCLECRNWSGSFLHFLVKFLSFCHNFRVSCPFFFKLVMMSLWHTDNSLWSLKPRKRTVLVLEPMINLANQKRLNEAFIVTRGVLFLLNIIEILLISLLISLLFKIWEFEPFSIGL